MSLLNKYPCICKLMKLPLHTHHTHTECESDTDSEAHSIDLCNFFNHQAKAAYITINKCK